MSAYCDQRPYPRGNYRENSHRKADGSIRCCSIDVDGRIDRCIAYPRDDDNPHPYDDAEEEDVTLGGTGSHHIDVVQKDNNDVNRSLKCFRHNLDGHIQGGEVRMKDAVGIDAGMVGVEDDYSSLYH